MRTTDSRSALLWMIQVSSCCAWLALAACKSDAVEQENKKFAPPKLPAAQSTPLPRPPLTPPSTALSAAASQQNPSPTLAAAEQTTVSEGAPDKTPPAAAPVSEAPAGDAPSSKPPSSAPPVLDEKEVARWAAGLLSSQVTSDAKSRIIDEHPEAASRLLAALVMGIQPGEDEYRRIPWIWQVSNKAGKGDDSRTLVDLLRVSLPKTDQPLQHWQAVVIGGGLINGISQSGKWPADRIQEILSPNPPLTQRFAHALQLAATMADDATVPEATRYDALRMMGVQTWEQRGTQISRYLTKETHAELQMGAVSAASDIRSPAATAALFSALPNLSPENRSLALDALLRDETRISFLRSMVKAGKITEAQLGEERMRKVEAASPGL